jgi:phosphohistidine phosphatase
MKTLILFRHGKSDWEEGEGKEDHDRPLSKRGVKAAQTMGKFLSLARAEPDSIVTSSAERARSTVELAADAGSWECPMRVTRALYEAAPERVLREIQAEPAKTKTLLLGGHEPTWSELVSLLVGGGRVRIPTACMARVDFEVESWKGVAFGKGLLVWVVPPKLLTAGDFDFV